MGKSLIILVAFLLVSISIGSTTVRAVDDTEYTPAPVPGPKYMPPPTAPVPAPKAPIPAPKAPAAPVPAPKTPAAPVPAPKAPAPTPKPKTPTPVPAPKTPAPAPKPKTPAPAPKPKTPAPTPKPKTPAPAPKPKTPAPAPKPKTPAPAPKPKTPAPAPKPKTPTPAPKPKTPAPAPKTPVPAPKPKTPAPVPAPKTPTPAPKPKTPAPAPKPKPIDDEVNYDVLTPEPKSGSERAFCKSKGNCYYKTLTCPKECPERKPKKNKKNKACHMNCGSKCEATCKWRRPKCNGYGSLCYDPRFVGGDGVMFYFHGGKGRDFALVSDTNLQINAHFIGSRPNGRKRDYTWVQSVSIMFDTQTLIISANKVLQWDDSVDVLSIKWNGEEVTVPFDGDSEWRTSTEEREVVVERTDDTNTVKVTVGGLVEIDMKAVKTPAPAPKPKTPTPAPKPKTPAPAPKTPVPAPKPKTPAPVPAPKTPTPAPKPKTPAPAPKPKPIDDEVNYDVLTPEPKSGSERAFCKSKGNCYYKTLTCPKECPERKPKKNKKNKACHMNCGSKCEATCKWRRPKCNGYGSLCYDPRFVGGDGVMFYFHGGKGRDFALVSDTNLQINAHFIGSRPNGRKRDYTWVQSVSIMFDTQTLIISANKVLQWDDSVDVLSIKWNGEEVTVPFDGDSEWRTSTEEREVVVERTDDTNTVKVTVGGLVEIDMKAVPVTKEDDKAHNYQLPSNDAFAHFELQFKFMNLSDDVEGILGKTYQSGYVSPVKRGIAMPIMGGEDKYETSSLTSTVCKECKFQTRTTARTAVIGLSQY
ncbi:hypothetical protein CTI12_AA242600 [Artemisia annua]|uniref:Uncharacterized protein n=1 Tax=Artemisia annua TaxID=35608 RepID=A0A2U1NPS1_ARTAN|nr:hypothetical protein CTI12_AA242600 [Artemisia annua]